MTGVENRDESTPSSSYFLSDYGALKPGPRDLASRSETGKDNWGSAWLATVFL